MALHLKDVNTLMSSGINFRAILAGRNFAKFVKHVFPEYEFNWHHEYLCRVLQAFAEGKIKKLMIFMPPQHGKSELVSRKLPAYLLGLNRNLKIAGVSYSHPLATKFNRELQRLMTSKEYEQVFLKTRLNSKRVVSDAKETWLRNADMFEVVGSKGSYMSVGIGGSLSGNTVDIGIIDDPVKDPAQAMSPTFQARNYNWYDSVFRTRLHNRSQVILCTTRWDENDLAGMILKREAEEWTVVSIPAIKEDESDPNDPRQIGEVLWEEWHSLQEILSIQKGNPKFYYSLYQQKPQPPNETLIMAHAKPCFKLPDQYERILGLDFGFSNSKTGIALLEIDRDNKRVWCKELCYKTGLTNPAIANILEPYSQYLVYCDTETKSIQELKDLGIMALPATKFQNSVLTQILYMMDWEIHYLGPNFEFEKKHWQWQLNPEGKPINQEIDKHNHLWKAVMYALYTHLREGYEEVEMTTTERRKPNQR